MGLHDEDRGDGREERGEGTDPLVPQLAADAVDGSDGHEPADERDESRRRGRQSGDLEDQRLRHQVEPSVDDVVPLEAGKVGEHRQREAPVLREGPARLCVPGLVVPHQRELAQRDETDDDVCRREGRCDQGSHDRGILKICVGLAGSLLRVAGPADAHRAGGISAVRPR